MLTPADIAEYGENHVEKWLEANNFQCYQSHQHQGVKDLEARNPEMSLLVHINTGLEPRQPKDLTEIESHSICSRAMTLGFDAWCAKVMIDAHGDLVGDIEWVKVN